MVIQVLLAVKKVVTIGSDGSTSGGGGFNNHNHRGFKSRKKYDKSNLFCDYCKFIGHTKEVCWKLHGYPTYYKFKKGRGVSTHVNNAINYGFEAPDEAVHSS